MTQCLLHPNNLTKSLVSSIFFFIGIFFLTTLFLFSCLYPRENSCELCNLAYLIEFVYNYFHRSEMNTEKNLILEGVVLVV